CVDGVRVTRHLALKTRDITAVLGDLPLQVGDVALERGYLSADTSDICVDVVDLRLKIIDLTLQCLKWAAVGSGMWCGVGSVCVPDTWQIGNDKHQEKEDRNRKQPTHHGL